MSICNHADGFINSNGEMMKTSKIVVLTLLCQVAMSQVSTVRPLFRNARTDSASVNRIIPKDSSRVYLPRKTQIDTLNFGTNHPAGSIRSGFDSARAATSSPWQITTAKIASEAVTSAKVDTGSLFTKFQRADERSVKIDGSLASGAGIAIGTINPVSFGGLTHTVEHSFDMRGDTLDCWFTGVGNHTYYTYSVDAKSVVWSTPVLVLSNHFFPTVVKYNGTYYLFAKKNSLTENIYAYSSTDRITFTALKGGSPILTRSTTPTDFNYYIFNTGFDIVDDTVHMLFDCSSSTSNFNLGYAWANINTLNFDDNKGTEPVIWNGGASQLMFVENRNAFLCLTYDQSSQHGGFGPGYTCDLVIFYASKTANLTADTSWKQATGFSITDPGHWLTDPSMIFTTSTSKSWGSLLYYNNDQDIGKVAYGGIDNETDFYDAVTNPVSVLNSNVSFGGMVKAREFQAGISGYRMRVDEDNREAFLETGYKHNNNQQSTINQEMKLRILPSGIMDIGSTGESRGAIGNFDQLTIYKDTYIGISGKVSLGASATDYPSIGYAIDFTDTSGVYRYRSGDGLGRIQFNLNGIQFYTAPTGTLGGQISFTSAMKMFNGKVAVGGTANPSETFEVQSGRLYLAGTSAATSGITFDSGGIYLETTTNNIVLSPGARVKITLSQVPVYTNNAAAVAGGLGQGVIYRTGGDPDALSIVH